MAHLRSPGAASLDKAADLLLAILDTDGNEGGDIALAEVAARLELPVSTAHRLASVLLRKGLVSRRGHGRYGLGLRLARTLTPGGDLAVLDAAARPLLRRLRRDVGATVHLGVLQGDMVTYVVKEEGDRGPALTSELMQLEAYCSGVGKALLAYLPIEIRDAYLAAGPFVALTPHTITDAEALRGVLDQIRVQGFARDDAELAEGLYCLAAPIILRDKTVSAAISISARADAPIAPRHLGPLRLCADRVARRLGV